MTVLAGVIRGSATGNPMWEATDGSVYYVLDYKDPQTGITVLPRPAVGTGGYGDKRDYIRRVGRQRYSLIGLGPMGWRFKVLTQAGNFVKLNDDSGDT
jgi:hypothetical protein